MVSWCIGRDEAGAVRVVMKMNVEEVKRESG